MRIMGTESAILSTQVPAVSGYDQFRSALANHKPEQTAVKDLTMERQPGHKLHATYAYAYS
jgi:hypothetical protein